MNKFVGMTLFLVFAQGVTAAPRRLQQAPEPCRILEAGQIGDEWKKIRVEKNGQPLAGADEFSDLVSLLNSEKQKKQCKVVSQKCEFVGAGMVSGAWMKHRLLLDGDPVLGSNELGTLSRELAELRRLGVCTAAL